MQKFLRTLMLLALMLPFASQAQETLTVHDGTTTNAYVPVYGYYADAYLRCQIVYPAAELSDMAGGSISGMTFYASQSSVSWGSANFEVKMTEVASATLSAFDNSASTSVYTGSLSISGNQMTVTFTTPYQYQGGNLLVEIDNLVTGTYVTSSWYGETVNGASGSAYSYSSISAASSFSQRNFIPKTTFTYEAGGDVSCYPVKGLAIIDSLTTPESITLSWVDTNNTDADYVVYIVDGTDTTEVDDGDLTLVGTTATIEGLEANTNYTFAVMADCGGGEVTAKRTVSGRTNCAPNAIPFVEYFDASVNDDPCWRGASNATAAQVFAGTALTLTTPAWSYTSSTRCGLEAGHYFRNVYGTNQKTWMITPEIDLSNATAPRLTFDVALTDYNNAALPDANGDTNTSQAFMVIISTDGGNTWSADDATVWQNVGGDYTYASLASTTYQNKVISLTQYVGETIKIAFYCQSIWSGGDNDLHIDNIIVGEEPNCDAITNLAVGDIFGRTADLTWHGTATSYVVEYKKNNSNVWSTANATDTAITLTNLDPETGYKARVTAMCGNDASLPSSMVSFTTKAACQVPTNVTVQAAAREAVVRWRDTIAEAWQIQYIAGTGANADTSEIIDVTDSTVYTLEDLTPETSYKVRVLANCDEDSLSVWTSWKSFTTPASCVVPTQLSVELTPGNGTIATISWVDSVAEQWAYMLIHGAETTYVEEITETTVDLEDLTPETAYKVCVRAICDVEDSSQWTSLVTFTPTNTYTVTVNDGTSTNSYVPIYGTWVDNHIHSQFIIPAEGLAPMMFGTIDSITFHASTASTNWGAARFRVFVNTVDETGVSTLADTSDMTLVYSGSLGISGNKMGIRFDEPYPYMGGNLMLAFEQPTSGTYVGCSWYGVSATGASMGGYGTSVSQQNFLPKMTFTFTPGEAPSCEVPTNLTITDTTGHTATFTWDGDANYMEYKKATDPNTAWVAVDASNSPFVLENLEQNTAYNVRAKVVCDADVYYSNVVSFTTVMTCADPYDVNVIAVPGSGSSVYVTWSDSVTTSNWQVRTVQNGLYSDIIDVEVADTVGGFLLTNLISEAHYTVEVRAVCDESENDISHWTGLEFVPSAATLRPVGIDTTATSNYLPTYNFYNYELTQQIYTPAELGEAGTISAIQFKNTGSEKTRNIDLYMVNTTKTSFTSTSDWITVTAADKVFSGAVTFVTGGEWTAITFDTPFDYDGTSNVAVIVDDNTGSYASSPHMACVVYDVTDYQALYVYSDGTNYNPLAPSGTGTRLNKKNHIRIAIGEPPACARPKNVTVSNIGKHEAMLHWTDTNASAWEVMVNGDMENLLPASADSLLLTGLQTNSPYTVSVRAICDPIEEEISEWSIPASFRTAVACPQPTSVRAVQGPFTAHVTWSYTDSEDATFTLYRVDGIDTVLVEEDIDTTVYDLAGLSPLTQYRYLLQANCDEGDANYVAFNFRTLDACVTPSGLHVVDSTITANGATIEWTGYQDSYNVRYRMPSGINPVFSDGFEGGLANWTVYTEGEEDGAWRVYDPTQGLSINAHGGDYVASAWSWNSEAIDADNWLVTPQLPLGGVLNYWVGTNEGYPDSYEVLVSTTGNAIANFTDTVKAMAIAGNIWTEVTIDLSAFAGQQGYIAFHHVDYDANYLLIDDVVYGTMQEASDWTEAVADTTSIVLNDLDAQTTYEVQVQGICEDSITAWTSAVTFTTLPSCLALTNVEAIAATANSITLTWTNPNEGSAASYVVTSGDSVVTITNVTDTGCVVTGLVPNTAYTFGVRAFCTDEDSSAIAGVSARTECNPLTELPYVENFEGDTRYCWDLVNFGVGSGADYALNGTKFLFANPTSDSSFAILPVMDTNISALALNFYHRHYVDSYSGGVLYVGYVNANGDTASFTAVDSINLATPNTSYSESNIYTFENAPAGSRMALRLMNSSNAILFDSVTVMERPTCFKPTSLAAVDVRNFTAKLSWTENGTATAWQIMLNDDEDNLIAADTTVFLLTNLEADSTYTVKVRANCGGANGVSEWSLPTTFTTLDSCPAPINITKTTTPYTVDIAWDETSSTPEAYNLYSVANGVNTLIASNLTAADLPYTVSGLTPETQYTFGVKTVCSEGEANIVTFTVTTNEVCPPGLVCIGAGTTTNSYLPTYSFYSYNLTQQIYTAAEIGDTGDIHSVAFYNGGSTMTRNIDVYLVNTTKTTFAGSSDWIAVTAADKVFSGSVTFTAGTWTTIPFTTLFNFDGNSNLALIIDDNTGSWSSGLACRVFDAPSQAIRIYSDGTDYDPAAPSSYSGTVMDQKNRVRFAIGEQPILHTVTVTVDPVGAGTVAGVPVVQVADGDSVTLTATANTGYIFTNWTNAEGDVISIDNPYTIEVTSDTAIVANFEEGSLNDSVILNVSVNNAAMGTTLPAPGSYVYHVGDTLSVKAFANAGYHLSGWVFGYTIGSNSNVDTIPFAIEDAFALWLDEEEEAMVVNHSMNGMTFNVQALFATGDPLPYTDSLTVTTSVNDATMGSITPAPGTHRYGLGNTVVFSFTPNDGYYLANIHVTAAHPLFPEGMDEIMTPEEFDLDTLVVDEDMLDYYLTVEAIFAPIGVQPVFYTVVARANDPMMGHIDGAPSTQVLENTVVNLTAVAEQGYRFVNWNNGATTAAISVTVTSDTILIANFEALPADTTYYTVAVTYDATRGNVTITPAQGPYAEGSNVGLVANAYEGFVFVAWLDENLDTLSTNTAYTIANIQANRRLTAVFDRRTGIADVNMANVTVFSVQNVIYVRGAEGQNVYLFDVNGRVLNHTTNAAESVEFRVANTGVYLVKVGEAAAKRVVVMR